MLSFFDILVLLVVVRKYSELLLSYYTIIIHFYDEESFELSAPLRE
jgi:hypothetical protein